MTVGVLRNIGDAWVDSRIPDILKRLHERDRLLGIDVIADPTSRQVMHYEVVRHGPRGVIEWVGRWGPHEVDQIVNEIAELDRLAHGHVETIDKLAKKELARERDTTRTFRDHYIAALEHGAKLVDEIENGKTFFGQAGMGESKPSHGK